MNNLELRWLEYEEEETIVPPVHDIKFGEPFQKGMVTKRKLQYRAYQNVAVYAGMPDQDFVNKTAKMQWSSWTDIPVVKA